MPRLGAAGKGGAGPGASPPCLARRFTPLVVPTFGVHTPDDRGLASAPEDDAMARPAFLLAGLLLAAPAVAQPPPEVAAALERMGRVIAPAPTAALYAPLHDPVPDLSIGVLRDISYGPDARHLLDVVAPPADGTPRPVLVFVHGGAFIGGDRRMAAAPTFYENIPLWAARQGFVGVSVTYRLAPANPYPAAQEDLGRALAWVSANIGPLGGDPARVVLMGHSAGAVHAALYAAEPRFHPAGVAPPRAYALVSGLYEFGDEEVPPPDRSYMGESAAERAARSPGAGLLRQAAPLLLAWGTQDPPRFVAQSEAMVAALRGAGAGPVAVPLEGHTHMSEIMAIGTADTSLSAPLAEFLRR